MTIFSGMHELNSLPGCNARAEPIVHVTSGPSTIMIGSVTAACAVAVGLAIAWLVHRRAFWRRSKPVGSLRDQLAKHRVPIGRKLHKADVTFELDNGGQPRLLGEGTFGKVRALQSHYFDQLMCCVHVLSLRGSGAGRRR